MALYCKEAFQGQSSLAGYRSQCVGATALPSRELKLGCSPPSTNAVLPTGHELHPMGEFQILEFSR